MRVQPFGDRRPGPRAPRSSRRARSRTLHREVGSGGSFGASSLIQHVGLGSAEKIDELEVAWPASGRTQRWTDVAANRRLRIVEGEDELAVVNEARISFDE